ncbi:hypothetical protein SAMN02745119_00747 [Trichlorobacter thiogenes]|uniref:Uncharacterized protein n=1 Tax=Trichlorobacter thiogenes TaxID=115783 RepID=A0A1T4L3H7_9BACT|nr:hypothetical protein [Trichlorobacter thiogenes]SJZ49266.1 hypothetical protein SAMN02745119_00747 [Trichlorobacter thiogenes]
MPEFASNARTTRKQIDPREYFSWTTPNRKVTAQATDPFVTAGNIQRQPDPNLMAFVDSMKNISDLTNGYIQVQKSYGKENQQKAVADAVTGKPQATEHEGLFNGGYGYNEAYNVTIGESKGLAFSKEYMTKLEENQYFQNQPDPQVAHKKFFDDLYQHHFQTVGDNPQILFGASERLKQAQVEGSVAMQSAAHRVSKETFMNSMSTLQQDHLFTYARSDKSTTSLEQLRKALNDDWDFKAKPTNLLSRDEYTKTVIQNIAHSAVQLAEDPREGTHEAVDKAYKLLELFDVADPDTKQSWATMVDGKGELKFRETIDHVTNQIAKIQERREQADAKALKAKQEAALKSLFVDVILNPDMELSEKEQLITSNKYLDYTQIEKLVDKATAYHKDEHSIHEDHNTIVGLRGNIEMTSSIKTLEALRGEVMSQYGYTLKSGTATELLSRITSRIDHINSEGRANAQLSLEQKKLGYDMVQKVIGAPSAMDMDGTQAALRMNTYGRMFFGRVSQGEEPTQVSAALIEHYSKLSKRTQKNTLGPSKFKTREQIRDAVHSGKLRADEGLLELKRFDGVE